MGTKYVDPDKIKQFTDIEERELIVKMRNGDAEAREQLIFSCIPWVIRLAREFCSKYNWSDVEEAESRSLLRLVKCVDRLDPAKGRLTTLLGTSVPRDLMNMMGDTRLIKIPRPYEDRYKTYRTEISKTDHIFSLSLAGDVKDDFRHDLEIENKEQAEIDSRRFEHACKSLTEKQFNGFIRHFVYEETLESIANSKGVTRQAVQQYCQKSVDKVTREIIACPREIRLTQKQIEKIKK